MAFEQRHDPLLPPYLFLLRVARWTALAGIILLGSLAVRVWGYHYFEGLSWLDSLLNASMIAGGMGPVDPIKTTGGKLFASFYALYSGMAIISAAGVLFAPIFHRFMHGFHLDADDSKEE
jgi:hypothetical protein